ncbi:MAG: hypothetical protein R3F56_07570 [Planctomycetota bacterium]
MVLSNSVQFHPWAPWTPVPVGMVDPQGLGNSGSPRGNQGMMVRFE